jgi:hypothetical protein
MQLFEFDLIAGSLGRNALAVVVQSTLSGRFLIDIEPVIPQSSVIEPQRSKWFNP